MPLPTGTRLGPYEVLSLLGAGGMGEVYSARDAKLNRDVAVKVLPEAFGHDPDRLARFEREAQVLASLNHPNIGAIFGFEESVDGVRALVLELVQGPTLADRIAEGPIRPPEALLIARQIADALEAAHEHGIIHRDLKPSNIKLRPDGTVKVLDFGLAKAFAPDAMGVVPGDLSQSPTIAAPPGTLVGVILGTAAYMSPEQARGKSVDRRTDIFSFGCVLYEMLAGHPAFQGDSVSEILARVIERDPDWSRLPAALPARMDELLRRCLEKDPRKRRRDMGDVRIEIEQALSDPRHEAAPPVDNRSGRRGRLAWIVATVLGVALAVTLARLYFFEPDPAPETRVDVSTPETSDPTSFAISPDGRRLVFVAFRSGQPQLHLRSLDADTAQPLNGTEGATIPFWSPDGRSVGFFSNSQMKRIDLDGRLIQTLASALPGQGGTWGPDGVILFAPTQTGPLFRVPASGGEPVAATRLAAGQSAHRFPSLLPGGRQFLFYATGTTETRGIYLGSFASQETARLTDADTAGVYVTPGWLLFARGGALVARRFDPVRRELNGDPVTVAESVAAVGPSIPRGGFSVSATGVIAYRTSITSLSQLTWFDRTGKVLGTLGEPDRASLNVELSPDGRRAAVLRTVQNNADVWLIDPARTMRFTVDTGTENYPVWSPDGDRIAFLSEVDGGYALSQGASGVPGANELLFASPLIKIPTDWSHDGRFLLYFEANLKSGADLWALPLDGDRKPSPFFSTGFAELWGQFSPDGRWVAYQSNESGRPEIYVRPFPGPGGQWLVSTSGGTYPRWSADGKELFYLAPDGRLMAASIAAKGATLDVAAPAALFQTRIVGGGAALVGIRQQYDVAPDGRFLINVPTESAATPPITLILNWRAQ
ncbi:MAG TPA: protein kinase [Vicinamibacterales bacterium]|jgi:serine/threonine protein kinase/Tol biopolymer transport system component|nr:protein kinase [Vicinamibacterales bacterium]